MQDSRPYPSTVGTCSLVCKLRAVVFLVDVRYDSQLRLAFPLNGSHFIRRSFSAGKSESNDQSFESGARFYAKHWLAGAQAL